MIVKYGQQGFNKGLHKMEKITGKTIGFIGAGKMATAIMKGLLASNIFDNKHIIASEPNLESAHKTEKELGIKMVHNNREAAAGADIILLAVKPFVVKDVLGFFNWLVLGNFVAKGVALAMDKNKSLLKNPKESSFFKKKLKTRDEVLIEGLKRSNISAVTKDGKALKFSQMMKLLPASETGKAVRRQLKILNLAQIAGYLYSGLVLGIGIPKLNIYMTNKSEAKRKARLAEQKAQAQITDVNSSLVNMKVKNLNEFTALK